MECCLPADKLHALQAEIRSVVGLRKIQLRQLQSLFGKSNFACRILPMGRVFCCRLSAVTAGVSFPQHFITLTREHWEDLRVWHIYLDCYNARTLWMEGPVSSFDLDFFTNAAGPVSRPMLGRGGVRDGGQRIGVGRGFLGTWFCWNIFW